MKIPMADDQTNHMAEALSSEHGNSVNGVGLHPFGVDINEPPRVERHEAHKVGSANIFQVPVHQNGKAGSRIPASSALRIETHTSMVWRGQISIRKTLRLMRARGASNPQVPLSRDSTATDPEELSRR